MDVIDGTFVVVIPDLSQRLIGRQTVLSIRAVCFLLNASQTLARNRQPSLQICSHRQYSLVPGAGIDPARHGRFPVKPKAMYQTSCIMLIVMLPGVWKMPPAYRGLARPQVVALTSKLTP